MTRISELFCNNDEWITGKGQPVINCPVFIWGLLDIIKIWLDLFSIDLGKSVTGWARGEPSALCHSCQSCWRTNTGDLQHYCGSTFPRAFTMPLRCLSEPTTVMTNIIYANVIRPGNTIAELGVPAEIYHRTRRDSKPSIKILDFSGLDLPVINKAVEVRKVCRATSWSLVSCVPPGKGLISMLRWRRWCRKQKQEQLWSEVGKRTPRGRSPQVLGLEGPAEFGCPCPCPCPSLSPVSFQGKLQLCERPAALSADFLLSGGAASSWSGRPIW